MNLRQIEQADEPAWMAYTMSMLSMAQAYGIPFDRNEVINGASLILERLDELEWNSQQPPDPYPDKVRDEALKFMEQVHQRILDHWSSVSETQAEAQDDEVSRIIREPDEYRIVLEDTPADDDLY